MAEENTLLLGVDIGSTTVKILVMQNGKVIHSRYSRHMSQVRQKTLELLEEAAPFLVGKSFRIAISGSAGIGLAKAAELPFVQEVFATYAMVREEAPETDIVIELGGEDAKIIFLKGGIDERMNGTCAGGTGAFIDQMATLLNVTPDELDRLSLHCQKIYPIASRCGVFAKTDIQPLLNQGVAKEDIAASIYYSVVNQTIAGLAQGRKLAGKIMFLGGPLYYDQGLRKAFIDVLKLAPADAMFPEDGLYSVAKGAAIYAASQQETVTYEDVLERVKATVGQEGQLRHTPPLFANTEEFNEFNERHAKEDLPRSDYRTYRGNGYLGVDCGSTTTKLVLIGENNELLWSFYDSNKGNPVDVVRRQLEHLYDTVCQDRICIRGSMVTGYGEELIKNAFHLDGGLVETMAHFMGSRHFCPNVDFILDIGGQDIKCMKIKNHAIDNIMLNEACSSGCGSFIETFAAAMGVRAEEFAKLGLFADAPVELGSRCTVFMNSSIKQAQKDGASIENISAGLSISVIKNAIYKVIRAHSPKDLGENIVVQGGTFLNDAVLRSFEKEIGRPVIRPAIAGLMGAFGAALYAKECAKDRSSILTREALSQFTHTSSPSVCQGCTNRCSITVNRFSDGSAFISGNKCERMSGKKDYKPLPNLYRFKRERLAALVPVENASITVGIPLTLGAYDLAVFWHALFSKLGIAVRFSGFSSRDIYSLGQDSIPSDTACYPAKIMHGHIEKLLSEQVDAIFAPCLSYNFDEERGDNHYNCPVVAYYSEVLKDNMESLAGKTFLYPYLNINDPKELVRELTYELAPLGRFAKKTLSGAVKAAFAAYRSYQAEIRQEGERALADARARGGRIMILAGRPYHIDPEISHGIDQLAEKLGFTVVSEDSVYHLTDPVKVKVLNQWTYHTRLYNAAKFASEQPDVELVQLVSFGCGIDAITTDETRRILERQNKLYTQIKIDEITNLGAVTIRLRSLLGAVEMREKRKGREETDG